MMWKQQSQVLWLKKGDKNSKFFHTKASTHRMRNRLDRLRNERGEWLEGEILDTHIVNYFQELFTTNPENEPLTLLASVQRRITTGMCEEIS